MSHKEIGRRARFRLTRGQRFRIPEGHRDRIEGPIELVVKARVPENNSDFPESFDSIEGAELARVRVSVRARDRIIIGSVRSLDCFEGIPIAVLQRSDDIDATVSRLLRDARMDVRSRIESYRDTVKADGPTFDDWQALNGLPADEYMEKLVELSRTQRNIELERDALGMEQKRVLSLARLLLDYPDTYFSKAIIVGKDYPVSPIAATIRFMHDKKGPHAMVRPLAADSYVVRAREGMYLNLGNSVFVRLVDGEVPSLPQSK